MFDRNPPVDESYTRALRERCERAAAQERDARRQIQLLKEARAVAGPEAN